MRFTGSIDAKTDEKGRVFVPSVFRKVLQKEEEEGLVLRRDIFENCLVLYPKSVWDAQVDSVRARTNPFDRHQRQGMRLSLRNERSCQRPCAGIGPDRDRLHRLYPLYTTLCES